MDKYFRSLVGQDSIKRQLGFYIDTFQETRTMPFLGFFSPKGYGKTVFAKKTMEHLTRSDGGQRANITINCAIIRNNQSFFEDIVIRIISGNQVNILFDEAHNIPNDVAQSLLTICDVQEDPVREFEYNEGRFIFDFTKICFLFATTEPDKVFPPLRDRLQAVEFRPYTKQDIHEMVDLYCPDVIFGDNVKDSIVDSIRDNPRSVVKRSQEINRYAFGHKKSPHFGLKEWDELSYKLGINPLGLENTEIALLSVLFERGPCSLQTLANVCGMSRTALRSSVESRLIKCGLIEIDVKRRLTQRGRELTQKLKNSGKLVEIF